MSQKINRVLLPDIKYSDERGEHIFSYNEEDGVSPLEQAITAFKTNENDGKSLLLTAVGGQGKTTTLRTLWLDFLRGKNNIPCLYVDCKLLKRGDRDNAIHRFIEKEYGINIIEVKSKLIILIDGANETDYILRGKKGEEDSCYFISECKNLIKNKYRFIISSRSKEITEKYQNDFNNDPEFNANEIKYLELTSLTKEKISSVLPQGVTVSKESALYSLLKNNMMLSIYLYLDEYGIKIEQDEINAGRLLDQYFKICVKTRFVSNCLEFEEPKKERDLYKVIMDIEKKAQEELAGEELEIYEVLQKYQRLLVCLDNYFSEFESEYLAKSNCDKNVIFNITEDEELRLKALKLCDEEIVSVSMFQQIFGYVRACKLIDWLEGEGYISSSRDGDKRKVQISASDYFEFMSKHNVNTESYLNLEAKNKDLIINADYLKINNYLMPIFNNVSIVCRNADGFYVWSNEMYQEYFEARHISKLISAFLDKDDGESFKKLMLGVSVRLIKQSNVTVAEAYRGGYNEHCFKILQYIGELLQLDADKIFILMNKLRPYCIKLDGLDFFLYANNVEKGKLSLLEWLTTISGLVCNHIPRKSTYVPRQAFMGCSLLERIRIIPKKNLSIMSDAFCRCSNLRELELGEGIQYIGDNAFFGCGKLIKICFPNTLLEIACGAFEGCQKLKKIEFGKGLQFVGDDAFGYCESLKKICLPEGLKRISESAFLGCDNLEYIKIPQETIIYEEYGNEVIKTKFKGCNAIVERY